MGRAPAQLRFTYGGVPVETTMRIRSAHQGWLVAMVATVAFGWGSGPAAAQAGGGSAGDPDAVAILEDASAQYAALEGFCADFQQRRIIPIMDREAESEGQLCQMDPGYFRMDYRDPEGDRVVADGEYVWVYYPSSDPRQVIRSTPSPGQHRFDFHAEFLSDPGERYAPSLEGEDEVDGHEVHVLDLEPLERTAFRTARLWIDVEEGLIRKVELEEENESIRVVELRDLRLNPGMTPEDFAFQVPEGAQVIDR